MSSRRTLAGAILLFAAAAAAGFCLATREGAVSRNAAVLPAPAPAPGVVGLPRPDFSLPDLDGVLRDASEWNGRVLAINFWATWCPPCRKEIPEFVALQEKYGERGLQFIGIALEDPESVRPFVADMGMNYPVLTGQTEVIRVAEAYGNLIGALPFTAIVDRAGVVRFLKAGPLPGVDAEAVILPLL